MKGKKTTLNPWQQKWLAENFAETSNADCAKNLNVGWRTVVRIARQMGLEKSQAFMERSWRKGVETMRIMNQGEGNKGKINLLIYGKQHQFKPGITSRQRLGDEREVERIKKAAASRRETVRKELIRIRWGIEQKTKLRLVSNDKQRLMRYALRKRGYIVPRAAIDVFYNSDTRRSALVEKHAEESGIRIYQQRNEHL